jgi:hypothetical protein
VSDGVSATVTRTPRPMVGEATAHVQDRKV